MALYSRGSKYNDSDHHVTENQPSFCLLRHLSSGILFMIQWRRRKNPGMLQFASLCSLVKGGFRVSFALRGNITSFNTQG